MSSRRFFVTSGPAETVQKLVGELCNERKLNDLATETTEQKFGPYVR